MLRTSNCSLLLIYLPGKAELAWLADLQRTVYPHKWSSGSCRSSSVQGKFAGQRPVLYHCTMQPTQWLRKKILQVQVLCVRRSRSRTLSRTSVLMTSHTELLWRTMHEHRTLNYWWMEADHLSQHQRIIVGCNFVLQEFVQSYIYIEYRLCFIWLLTSDMKLSVISNCMILWICKRFLIIKPVCV